MDKWRIKKMDFLTNLDYLLKSHDMKRADLARAIHVAPSTINSWYARGSEKVNLNVLKDIAAYFNVSLEVLVNGDMYTSVCFTDNDYTKEELELIANFGKMLKESRVKHG
jgi:transcriptional regulator with XRE-family HTH domain